MSRWPCSCEPPPPTSPGARWLHTRPTLLRALTSDQTAMVPTVALPLLEPLSPQEQRILRMIVAGRSNPEIARDLVVSANTVKTHIKNIYRKLNVGTRAEAQAAARELHLR